jgi:predicted nucleotidyltransferase
MAVLDRHRADILRIAARYGATNIRVAGADDGPGSDLDFVVDMEPGRSLFDLVDLGHELQQLLGRRVEVLTAATLSPRLLASIRAETL